MKKAPLLNSTLAMLRTSDKPMTVLATISEDERLKQEKMRDVLLILQHLAEREEATVNIILDALYDFGSAKLINQKFRRRTLNRAMKSLAGMSKPFFRMVALRWFKKNCPQLITDWLFSQVTEFVK